MKYQVPEIRQRDAGGVVNVGRKKLWQENLNVRLPEGAIGRMDAVLRDGEARLDMVREAIEKEVALREKSLAKGVNE